MPATASRRPFGKLSRILFWICSCFVAGIAWPAAARSQETGRSDLEIEKVVPSGVRSTATESWGTYEFRLTNRGDTDRLARVLVLYNGRPDIQYGRDVWVPAHSAVSTWMLVGPATPQEFGASRNIQFLLYDRTDGKERLILPPGEERVRERGVLYRKREPFTAVLLDTDIPEENVFGRLPQPDSPDDEALRLVRVFRSVAKLSEYVQRITDDTLPAMPEAFDGIDHFVLASNRVVNDLAGMRALRRWVQQGGKLWVMLDRVDPDNLAPLLGEALDFQLVDRVSLTRFQMATESTDKRVSEPVQQHERPVTLARILLPASEHGRNAVNGWPTWFTRPLGRGTIVFTTLGPRGWYRPREPREPASPYPLYPTLPIPRGPLERLAGELQPAREEDPFPAEAFHKPLVEEIGYSILNRRTVGLIFGAFLASTLVVGALLRRSRRPELVGWLAPVAALGSAAAFVALGETSRHAAAPTVAVAQIVEPVAGTEEAALHGLVAVYRPDSGPADLAAEQGGLFEMDMAGIEGQTRRFVLDDRDAWHWEGLSLPAGVRFAPFRFTTPTQEPMTATAHFGPDGLVGKVAAGPFQNPGDALLVTPSGRNLAVTLDQDGSFRAGAADVLLRNQFLAGALLTDRQQRRQELYREFSQRSGPFRQPDQAVLLAWADSLDMHFRLATDARTVGSALLVFPLRLERSSAGERVIIPGALLSCRRILETGPVRPVQVSDLRMEQDLRFQLPAALLPFKIEKARFLAKIEAPGRRVGVAAGPPGQSKEVFQVESPLEPLQIEIPGESLLIDASGGLHIQLFISEPLKAGDKTLSGSDKWNIDYLELEVTGQAE